MIFESIKILNDSYPLNTICNVLGVNKSSYLYWLNISSPKEIYSIHFFNLIIEIYAKSKGIYGSPKITYTLNNDYNISCSVSKVSRAMALLGIKSIVSKSFPKVISRITDNEKSLIVNLIKDLDITHINQVWTTDITYIKTIYEGTFYLISFIDYYSKKVVAWGLFEDQKTDKILLVLDKAVKDDLKAMAKEKVNSQKLISLEEVNNIRKDKAKLNKSKFDFERRIAQIDRIIKASYEDKVNGILTVEEFIKITDEYKKEKQELKVKVNELEKNLSTYKETKEDELTKIIKNITDFDNINKETIVSLINRIEIIDSETIKIYYKFSE